MHLTQTDQHKIAASTFRAVKALFFQRINALR